MNTSLVAQTRQVINGVNVLLSIYENEKEISVKFNWTNANNCGCFDRVIYCKKRGQFYVPYFFVDTKNLFGTKEKMIETARLLIS